MRATYHVYVVDIAQKRVSAVDQVSPESDPEIAFFDRVRDLILATQHDPTIYRVELYVQEHAIDASRLSHWAAIADGRAAINYTMSGDSQNVVENLGLPGSWTLPLSGCPCSEPRSPKIWRGDHTGWCRMAVKIGAR